MMDEAQLREMERALRLALRDGDTLIPREWGQAILAALRAERAQREQAEQEAEQAEQEAEQAGLLEAERDALRAQVDEWRSMSAADKTGHLFRCARVNGVWSCHAGCPADQLARLADTEGLAEAIERAMTLGDAYRPSDVARAVQAWVRGGPKR